MSEYKNEHGFTFRFNDHVCMEGTFGSPLFKRTGRLVQVRKGVGAFCSDVYFIRLRDGGLMTWENVLMRPVGDRKFEDAWYRSNPPVIPEQPVCEDDSTEVAYTIGTEFPETGFIIEHPKQPESEKQSFSMMITKQK